MRRVSSPGYSIRNLAQINRYSPKRVSRASNIFAGAFVCEISDFFPSVHLRSSNSLVYGCSLWLSRNTYT